MKRKQDVIINCSNLHKGGAVTVASSFIDCLSKKNYDDIRISLLLSEKVLKNINKSETNLSKFKNVKIINNFGIWMLFFNYFKHFKSIDIVFSIFGPSYNLNNKFKHIIGLADPYIIYKDNFYLQNKASLKFKIINKLIVFIKNIFLNNTDTFIVETERVKKEMIKNKNFQKKKIYVVSNTINAIFSNKKYWKRFDFKVSSNCLKLGIISRNYPHKNLEILPSVKSVLEKKFKLKVEIFVTFNDKEWENTSYTFKNEIKNVGPLLINECPYFYAKVDAIIMPTLLEVMSALPLEAMYMSKPLFCSNLNFMREICNKYAIYFNPLDANDIAKKINKFFLMSINEQKSWTNNAKRFISKVPTEEERCRNYMSIIRENLH